MAHPALVAMMMRKGGAPKKAPPRFADEGEPEESGERGGAEGGEPDEGEAEADEEGAAPADNGGGGYDEHEQLAADDLADTLGVAHEDRADFQNALSAYVSACIAKHLGGGGEPGEGEETPEE